MAKEVRDRKAASGWWRVAGWGLAGALLLLPLAAMQVTADVRWSAFDFMFASVLIGGVGIGIELAMRASGSLAYRGGAALMLAAVFLLTWLNGAVGIIGDGDNRLNLIYAGVIAVALGGAALARLRARGMARALTAAAVAQALAGVVAVIAGADEPPGPLGLVILNGGFVAMFAAAAWLMRRAVLNAGADDRG